MTGLLALSRGIDRANRLIGRSVSWLILIAVLVSAANAIVRKLFNMSSNAWLEAQWYLYGTAFLLAAAYTLLENEHIRIDIVYGTWPRRVQHWIDLIGHVFFLLPFTGLAIYLIAPWVLRSIELGEISMNAGGLILWPAKAMLLIGMSLLFLQGISEIIKKVAVMRGLLPDDHLGENSEQAFAAELAGEAHHDHVNPQEPKA